jgi:hypothetical protein
MKTIEITPTIEPQANQSCPIPSQMPQPLELGVHSAMPGNILAYLNAGGTAEQLKTALRDAGVLAGDLMGIYEKDFTGDGFNDLAFSIMDPNAQEILPVGTLLIYVCQDKSYQLAYSAAPGVDWSVPTIDEANDLNGDGIADILFSQETCGAHTCFKHYEVLIWSDDAFENALQGTTDDIPNPNLEIMFPPHARIGVIATGYGSVGAGPFRPFEREWTWDPDQQAFTPSPDIPLPSTYRVHTLYDADRLAKEGELTRALSLYQEVIENDGLQDWIDPEMERANLGAYARFRIMLTYLLLEDRSAAENTYIALQDHFPLGTQGAAFTALAGAFWNEYAESADIAAGCSAAQSYAQSHVDTVLDALYFGYSNPSYEAEDICPYSP